MVADALSRVPLETGIKWEKIVEKYSREEIPYVLRGDQLILDKCTIEKETQKDETLIKVAKNIKENWVEEPEGLEPYYQIRNELYSDGKLIIKLPGLIVIPENLRIHILNSLHRAHFGIARTKARARRFVWWPGINAQIEDFSGMRFMSEKCPTSA